jgi:hypothetical protein
MAADVNNTATTGASHQIRIPTLILKDQRSESY